MGLLARGQGTPSALPESPPPPTPPPKPARSVIYYEHNPDAISGFTPEGRIVRGMVDRVVMAATGQSDIGRAWATLISPNDKVGIKISSAGGQLFTTHRDVVNAIVDGLVAAGHPRNTIIVWDKSLSKIKEAGYRPNEEGYQLREITPRTGYEEKATFTAPVLA